MCAAEKYPPCCSHKERARSRILDKLREVHLLVQLSFWFEQNDREALKQALETEEGATDWARRMIRGGGDILPRLPMDPAEAKAHLVQSSIKVSGAQRRAREVYVLPEPLDPSSVRYCSKHLDKQRERGREKSRKLARVPNLNDALRRVKDESDGSELVAFQSVKGYTPADVWARKA
jgi:hypothetical protein